MPIIRLKQIERKMVGSAKFQAKADSVVEATVERARARLLNDFDQHLVTQEIKAGVNSENLSKTIKGSGGNLWGFIGFKENPLSKIRDYLYSVVRYEKKTVKDDLIVYKITVPTLTDIYKETPYPDGWSSGSWVKGIQSGISGFRFFLAEALKGRSGGGIQIEGDLRGGGSYKPIDYINLMLQKFKSRIKKGKSVV